MGEIFNSLVEVVNRIDKFVKPHEALALEKKKPVKTFLQSILSIETALFEMNLHGQEIREYKKKTSPEYYQDLLKYFKLCKKENTPILTPFPRTIIEDSKSATIVIPQGQNMLAMDYALIPDGTKEPTKQIIIGTLSNHEIILKPEGIAPRAKMALIYYAAWKGKTRLLPKQEISQEEFLNKGLKDLINAAFSYIQQAAYIVDPKNFIIEEESRESRDYSEKNKDEEKKQNKNQKKKPERIRKTILRPVYKLKSSEEVERLFSRATGGKKTPHPVKGHERTYKSSRYVNVKGDTAWIEQYWTGKGSFSDKRATYQVWIKKKDKETGSMRVVRGGE